MTLFVVCAVLVVMAVLAGGMVGARPRGRDLQAHDDSRVLADAVEGREPA